MLPALITLIIFKYYPMYGLQIAFRDYRPTDGIVGSMWVGLDNIKRFVSSFYFSRILINTLRISLYEFLTGYPLAIIFALFLNIIRRSLMKRFIQTITYIPHFISVVVLVGILYQILNPVNGLYGMLYRLINDTGGYPKNILVNPNVFIHLYVWSGIWQNLGWSSIIFIAALSTVNLHLYEAAVIDGASRWKCIFLIDIPQILPTISILLILRLGHLMGVGFEKVFLMQNGVNLGQSEVISTYVYKVGLTGGGDFSYGTAIGLFNSIINATLLILANSLSKRFSRDGASLF